MRHDRLMAQIYDVFANEANEVRCSPAMYLEQALDSTSLFGLLI